MMSYIIPLIASTIAALIVQLLWYNPLIFGTQWLTYSKMKPAQVRGLAPVAVVSTIVTHIFRSVVLLILFILLLPSTEVEVLSLVVLLWAGVLLPDFVQMFSWSKQKKELLYIYTFGSLASFVVQALVLWLTLHAFNAPLIS